MMNNKVEMVVVRHILDNIPLSESDKRKDKIFAGLIVGIFIIGLTASIIFGNIFNSIITVLGIIVTFALGIAVGMINRNRVYNIFYKIKDANKYFKMVNLEDKNKLKELCDKSALSLIAYPDVVCLDFIYNWLNITGVIKNQEITIYVFNGALIKDTFGSSLKFDDREVLFSIEPNDLRIKEITPEEAPNHPFYKSKIYADARWLDDIISNAK